MAEVLIPLAISATISLIELALTPSQPKPTSTPGSQYGVGIPKGYGTFRVDGNWIFPEYSSQAYRISSGKGKGGNGTSYKSNKKNSTVFFYGMAIFCEGTVDANWIILNGNYYSPYGQEVWYTNEYGQGWYISGNNDYWNNVVEFFNGSPTQSPWHYAQGINGIPYTPAYRGIAAIGLQDLPDTNFGNTFPSQFGCCFNNIKFGNQNSANGSIGANPTYGEIIGDICKQSGLIEYDSNTGIGDFDVSELTSSIAGFIFNKAGGNYKDPISQLMTVGLIYNTKLINGVSAFRYYDRGNTEPYLIPASDFGAIDGTQSSNNQFYNIIRTNISDIELPSKVILKFYDIDNKLNRGSSTQVVNWATWSNELSIETECTFTVVGAANTAKAILQQIWAQRVKYEFSLSPKWINLINGDLIELPNGEIIQLDNIQIGINYIILCKAHSYTPTSHIPLFTVNNGTQSSPVESGSSSGAGGIGLSISGQAGKGVSQNNDNVPITSSSSNINGLTILDINLVTDTDNSEQGIYITANTNVGVYASIDDVNYVQINAGVSMGMAAQITSGQLTNLTNLNPTSTLDTTSSITIPKAIGYLEKISSATTVQPLAQTLTKNVFLIGSNSPWSGEIVVAQDVETSGDNYILSNFLRGQRGTNDAMGSHSTSEWVVLLKGSGSNLSRIPIQSQYINQTLYFHTRNQGYQDHYSETNPITITYKANSLKPYSVINIGYQYDADQNILITWTKRDRGVGLNTGEEIEKYVLNIMNGTLVKSSFTLESPFFAYSKAQQITDWGSVQTTLTVNIYKVSNLVGNGYLATYTGSITAADGSGNIIGSPTSEINKGSRTITGTTYTITDADKGYYLIFTQPATITLSNTLPLNFNCSCVNKSTGNLTFTGTSINFTTGSTIYPNETGHVIQNGNAFTIDTPTPIGTGSSVTTFLTLTDAPHTYSGKAKYISSVSTDETGLIFYFKVGTDADNVLQIGSDGKLPVIDGSNLTGITATSSFITLTDAPNSYTGKINYVPSVNLSGNGLAFNYKIGTQANNILQIGSDGKLPVIDGSNLTGITSFTSPLNTTGDIYFRDNVSDTRLPVVNNKFIKGVSNIPTYSDITLTDITGLTGTPNSTTVLHGDGSWSAISGGVSDGKVLVDSTDTTADYLTAKLLAGSGINLPISNSGADEAITVEVVSDYTQETASRDLTQADNQKTLNCSGTITLNIVTGLFKFGLIVAIQSGSVSFTTATGVTLIDETAGSPTTYGLIQTNTNSFKLVGTVAGGSGTSFTSPLNTTGDIYFRDTVGDTRLPVVNNKFIKGVSGLPTYSDITLNDITGLTGTADSTTVLHGDGSWSAITGSGSGDMTKAIYDPTDSGKVAEALLADNILGTSTAGSYIFYGTDGTGTPGLYQLPLSNFDTTIKPALLSRALIGWSGTSLTSDIGSLASNNATSGSQSLSTTVHNAETKSLVYSLGTNSNCSYNLNTTLASLTQFSISSWAYFTAFNYGGPWGAMDGGTNSQIGLTNGLGGTPSSPAQMIFRVWFNDGSQSYVEQPTPSISLNTWYHFLAEVDITNHIIRLFINNVLIGTASINTGTTMKVVGHPFSLGGYATSNNGITCMTGNLDQTIIFTGNTTSSERSWLYNLGLGNTLLTTNGTTTNSSDWVLQTVATSNTTLTLNKSKVPCNTSGGSFNVTFPPAATSGDTYVKLIDTFKTDSTSTTNGWGKNKVTCVALSGYTIETGATFDLNRSSIAPEFCLDAGTTDWYISGGTVR